VVEGNVDLEDSDVEALDEEVVGADGVLKDDEDEDAEANDEAEQGGDARDEADQAGDAGDIPEKGEDGAPLSGSPKSSPEADYEGSRSPSSEAPDVQTDPYMLSTKEDEDVDEDFAASLRSNPSIEQEDDGEVSKSFEEAVNALSARSRDRIELLRMVATPAPLASPEPGEVSDPDDPLGLAESPRNKRLRRRRTRSIASNDGGESSGAERAKRRPRVMVLS
jgi:hypothetical protein